MPDLVKADKTKFFHPIDVADALIDGWEFPAAPTLSPAPVQTPVEPVKDDKKSSKKAAASDANDSIAGA